MRFIYSSDIHGDMFKYNKLHQVALKNEINTIVIGGDLFPKNAENRIPLQKKFIHNEFPKFFKKLENDNIIFIAIPGNDDLEINDTEYIKMISNFKNIIDINEKKYDIEDVSFIGMARVLDTPFKRKSRIVIEKGQEMPTQFSDKIYINNCKDIITPKEWEFIRRSEVPYMEDILSSLPQFTNGLKGIYIFHDPPSGIGLDCCKKGEKVGSKSITKFIKNSNAYMSLHGHIHESPDISGKWYDKIGNTICINPGQTEFGEDKLHYVLIDTNKNTYELRIENCTN